MSKAVQFFFMVYDRFRYPSHDKVPPKPCRPITSKLTCVMARLQQIALFAHAVCLMIQMRLANRDILKALKRVIQVRSRIRLQTCFSKVTYWGFNLWACHKEQLAWPNHGNAALWCELSSPIEFSRFDNSEAEVPLRNVELIPNRSLDSLGYLHAHGIS